MAEPISFGFRALGPAPMPGNPPQYSVREAAPGTIGRLLTVTATLTSMSPSTTRFPALVVRDVDGLLVAECPAFYVIGGGVGQESSQIVDYTWGVGFAAPIGGAVEGRVSAPIPEIVLRGGELVSIDTDALIATDMWSPLFLAFG